ncbi:MAG: transcription antitermination factor NusB [Deltaproteobacteria bacterium]|nr:transcription antitermination factor NusB [Deltaproteobacteria bacterium]MBN2674780.1 transcription antitermination factor NusB [Deltaproteobacteria bacterium]
MATRRRAREAVLQMLFQLESTGDSPEAVLLSYRSSFGEGSIPEEFSIHLFTQIATHVAQIDHTITSASDNWRLERMSRVDRNILRIGVFELTQTEVATPVKIVINEAVELAKRFGAEESAAFVNGVLDRIAKDVGSPD